MFLYGLVVPVTPTALENRVGIAKGDEQRWTSILLALYGAALFIAAPISGYIADRMESRRWPYLTGLIALAASTALLCVGTSLGLWIAGRLFQGASTAVVWTVGMALLVDSVEKEHLGQSLGYIGMATSLGSLTGPLLGGVIYQSGGYYAVFGTAFGLIGVDILLRIAVIEKKHARRWLENGAPQEITTMSACKTSETKTTLHITSTPDAPRDEEENNICRTVDTTREAPPSTDLPSTLTPKNRLPTTLILLFSPRLLCVFWGWLIVSLLLDAFDGVLPLFVSDTFHWKQAGQGLIFIPISVPQLIGPGVGALIDRIPHCRRYLAFGAFLCAVPPCVCLRFVLYDTIEHKVLLCGLLSALGFSIAFIIPVVGYEVNAVVVEKEQIDPQVFGKGGALAQAYGLTNSAIALGSLIGPILAGFIRDSAGWATMTSVLAIISGVSALPALLMSGGWSDTRQEMERNEYAN
ncbi:hypothetical protein FE257_008159 [Aspergillus nanangensis]|uniref:Major facilitator superfamily (MFS) profile domain-containing protein n=1 Tax=Aspergillus nanangensis TaxID=2582783 RepID=A0AAD4GSY9_ASPNN|nr:hypothetical protein FE257_008159 [Aspergillus nanangensis]